MTSSLPSPPGATAAPTPDSKVVPLLLLGAVLASIAPNVISALVTVIKYLDVDLLLFLVGVAVLPTVGIVLARAASKGTAQSAWTAAMVLALVTGLLGLLSLLGGFLYDVVYEVVQVPVLGTLYEGVLHPVGGPSGTVEWWFLLPAATSLTVFLVSAVQVVRAAPGRSGRPAADPVDVPRIPEGAYTVSHMGGVVGPYDATTLQREVAARSWSPATLLSFNGGEWFPAAQLPALFAPPPARRQFTTALLLSLLVGGLGADRFYLGYTGLGVIKLLTCGGCGIWSVVDLVLIATGRLTDADGQPLGR